MDAIVRKNELSRRDAALCSALTLGVLQNCAWFDFLISRFCATPPEKLEKKVLDILRLGVCQLVLLDRIPARAAVNETVALCDRVGAPRAKGLVNAVLRRLSEQRFALPEVPGRGEAGYLATRYSHPLWLAEKMIAEKGYAFAEALFAADNEISPLTIQINTLRVSVEDYRRSLDRLGIDYTVPPFPEGCLCVSGGSVPALPGFEEGLFYVQDRAARTAVDIAAPKRAMRVLDACASPGGKSFAAALDMGGEGDILSCDIHEKKLSLIRAGAERLGLPLIRTACRDARAAVDSDAAAYDLVIADVPCSGFGVISKKPEIRSKEPASIRDLPQIQYDILHALSFAVRPGGVLLYSTCTILREENEAVVERFLSSHPHFCLCPFAIEGRGQNKGCYTFYPNTDGTDGFFVAKLQRNTE